MCWWSCSYAFKYSYKEDSSLCTKFQNKSFPWSIPCWSALLWECRAQWGILPTWENAETVNGFGLSHTFTFLDFCYVHMWQPDFLPIIWPWKLVGCKHCLASEQRSEKWMCSVIGNLPWKKITKTSRAFPGFLWSESMMYTAHAPLLDYWRKISGATNLHSKNDKFWASNQGLQVMRMQVL
jgi:hypothetical protein